ncbi:MAG: AI-2E family transporter [Hyphomicrobiaceae bacterium]|nr:AI-2E family transporter [Hyphomicrobiaceae bacterium]
MTIERHVVFWLVAAVAVIALIGLLDEVLLPFVTALLLAYGLNPLVDALEHRGLPRLGASIAVVAVLVVGVVLLLVFLVPVLLTQAEQLIAALPGELQRLRGLMLDWAKSQYGGLPQVERAISQGFDALIGNWNGIAATAAASLWTQGKAIFNVVSIALVTPLVVFYLLVDWKRMLAEIDGWLPREHADTLRAMGSDINAAVGAFVRGQGTVCLVLGLFYAFALWASGLNYGFVIGAATGALAFVPVVGWIVGAVTGTTLAALQFWPEAWPVAIVAGIFLAGQALDAGFLSPTIVGSRIGLHPVWLLFALVAFSYLFGLVGTLVAVPLAAAVAVIVRYGLRAYLASSVYRGETAGAPPVVPADGPRERP